MGTPEECIKKRQTNKAYNDTAGQLAGGGFIGHACGSHDALNLPIKSKDAIDAAALDCSIFM